MNKQEYETRLKNLQIESLFLIKQVNELLSKQCHRMTIQKIQKFITKQKDCIIQLCASILIKILFLQTKAILKLLSRNIHKKYVYDQFQIKSMLSIVNRNNQQCSAMLITKVQSKQIFNESNQFFIANNSQNKTNLFKNQISNKEFQKLTKSFYEIYVQSLLYSLVTFNNYNLNIYQNNKAFELIDKFTVDNKQFTIKSQLSIIELKILICKITFENGSFIQALKMVDIILQNGLNLLYQIRIKNQRLLNQDEIASNTKNKLIKKFKYYTKKIYKLLLIGQILLMRINMHSGNQNFSVQAIKIFNFTLQKLDSDLNQFKKYLNPQVYILQQYCQYKTEKFEISKLIEVIFQKQTNNIQSIKNESDDFDQIKKVQENITLIEFYNEKMSEFNQKFAKQIKKSNLKRVNKNNAIKEAIQMKSMISNSKSKKGAELKNFKDCRNRNTCFTIHSSQSFYNQQSVEKGDSLQGISTNNNYLNFQSDFVNQINKLNENYLTQRKKRSQFLNRTGLLIRNQNNKSAIHGFNSSTISQENTHYEQNQIISPDKKLFSNSSFQGFLASREKGFNNTSNKKLISTVVNKKIITHNDLIHDFHEEEEKPKTILEAAQKLKDKDLNLTNDLKKNIQLLKVKKNTKINILNKVWKNSFLDDSQIITNDNVKSQSLHENQSHYHSEPNHFANFHNSRISGRPSQNKNSYLNIGIKYKDKLKFMNKKTKIQLLMQLLSDNKQYFGLKKWSQKVDYLKKKQELKIKMRSTRKTTSITYNNIGLPLNLSLMASDILKLSLEQIEQCRLNRKRRGKSKKPSANVDNSNNFLLGQKTITMLLGKLQKQKQQLLNNKQVHTPQKKKTKRNKWSAKCIL